MIKKIFKKKESKEIKELREFLISFGKRGVLPNDYQNNKEMKQIIQNFKKDNILDIRSDFYCYKEIYTYEFMKLFENDLINIKNDFSGNYAINYCKDLPYDLIFKHKDKISLRCLLSYNNFNENELEDIIEKFDNVNDNVFEIILEKNKDLSKEFIFKFKNKFGNSNILHYYDDLSEDFIKDNFTTKEIIDDLHLILKYIKNTDLFLEYLIENDKVDEKFWRYVSDKCDISESFIAKYKDKLYWKLILDRKTLSETFLMEHHQYFAMAAAQKQYHKNDKNSNNIANELILGIARGQLASYNNLYQRQLI